jgi:hypothetical protein
VRNDGRLLRRSNIASAERPTVESSTNDIFVIAISIGRFAGSASFCVLAFLGFRCAPSQALCCRPLRGLRIFHRGFVAEWLFVLSPATAGWESRYTANKKAGLKRVQPFLIQNCQAVPVLLLETVEILTRDDE